VSPYLTIASICAWVAAGIAGAAVMWAYQWRRRAREAIQARDFARLQQSGLENQMIDLLATAQEEINRRRRGGRDDQAIALRSRQIAEEIVHQHPEQVVDFVKRVFAETLPLPPMPAPLPPPPKGGP
jgi:hypothetical protein